MIWKEDIFYIELYLHKHWFISSRDFDLLGIYMKWKKKRNLLQSNLPIQFLRPTTLLKRHILFFVLNQFYFSRTTLMYGNHISMVFAPETLQFSPLMHACTGWSPSIQCYSRVGVHNVSSTGMVLSGLHITKCSFIINFQISPSS